MSGEMSMRFLTVMKEGGKTNSLHFNIKFEGEVTGTIYNLRREKAD
jgi:hypothetical protein